MTTSVTAATSLATLHKSPCDALEAATEFAVDARGQLVGTGSSMVMIYIDAAVRSLRHAHAALLILARADAPTPPPAGERWARLRFCNGMPTSVFLRREEATGTWVRGSADPGGTGVCSNPSTDVDWTMPSGPDLGRDVLACDAARVVAQGPIGASLLFDALAHFPWFYPGTATRWTTGVAGARSIVAALAGGRAPMAMDQMLTARYVDREILTVIETLGWRRDPSGCPVRA